MHARTHTSYDAIGTPGSPAVLSASLADVSKVLACRYLANVRLDIQYTPDILQTDAFLILELDISNDDGITFFPLSSQVVSTSNIAIYVDGNPYLTTGIPIILPGDQTSIGGTSYLGGLDITAVASHIRIRARESVSSDFGTLYVRASFLS